MKHAEIIVINQALSKLRISDFSKNKNIILVSTLQPCRLCEGYIQKMKVPRIIMGGKNYSGFSLFKRFFDKFGYLNSLFGGFEDQKALKMRDQLLDLRQRNPEFSNLDLADIHKKHLSNYPE